MVLAWTTVDGIDPLQFTWLVIVTLIGGTLAAGAANAINCYLDRDIDEIMVRTRRRPLPAHARRARGRARVRAHPHGHLLRPAGRDHEPRGGVPDAAGHRLLRGRLHDAAEALDAPEHRARWRRRRAAAGHRLGRGHRRHHAPGAAAVRHRLLLDAAPLLGALAAHPGRLRGGRRAHDAGRPTASPRRPARSRSTRS